MHKIADILKRRNIVAIIVAIMAALTVTFSLTAPTTAWAAPSAPKAESGASETASGGMGDIGVCGDSMPGKQQTKVLPVNRWSGVSKIHTRNDPADVGSMIQSQSAVINETQALSLGNSFYALTTEVTQFAGQFCIIDYAGGAVDKAAGTIGKAILASPIVVAAVIASFLFILFRRSKGKAVSWKDLAFKVLVVALLVLMTNGAMKSTGGDPSETKPTPYQPGTFSPGWFIVNIDKVTQLLAGTPVNALNDVSDTVLTDNDTRQFSCQTYESGLERLYYFQTGNKYGMGTIPKLVDDLWLQSGRKAWENAQFGVNNPYGDYSYCRTMERFAATPLYNSEPSIVGNTAQSAAQNVTVGDSKMTVAGGSYDKMFQEYDAVAWAQTNNNDDEDYGMIAQAACVLKDPSKYNDPAGWDVNKELFKKKFRDDNKDKLDAFQKACVAAFSSDQSKNQHSVVTDAFDWEKNPNEISKNSDGNLAARDFIMSIRGYNGAVGFTASIFYALSGIVILISFGLMSGGIMIAKIWALGLMLMLLFHLVVSLFKGEPGEIIKPLRGYLGMSLFVAFSTVLLAILTFITKLLVAFSSAAFPSGKGSSLAMVWVSAAPLVSILLLNQIFKSFSLPSPFSLKGGMAWAEAFKNGKIGEVANERQDRQVAEKREQDRDRREREEQRRREDASQRNEPIQRNPGDMAAAGVDAHGNPVGTAPVYDEDGRMVAPGSIPGAAESLTNGADPMDRTSSEDYSHVGERFDADVSKGEAINGPEGYELDTYGRDRGGEEILTKRVRFNERGEVDPNGMYYRKDGALEKAASGAWSIRQDGSVFDGDGRLIRDGITRATTKRERTKGYFDMLRAAGNKGIVPESAHRFTYAGQVARGVFSTAVDSAKGKLNEIKSNPLGTVGSLVSSGARLAAAAPGAAYRGVRYANNDPVGAAGKVMLAPARLAGAGGRKVAGGVSSGIRGQYQKMQSISSVDLAAARMSQEQGIRLEEARKQTLANNQVEFQNRRTKVMRKNNRIDDVDNYRLKNEVLERQRRQQRQGQGRGQGGSRADEKNERTEPPPLPPNPSDPT